jgi:hypothetical protein
VSAWVFLRRPLLVALVMSCSISLLTRGYLAPGLVASGIIAWSFVPLAEIAGLFAVLRGRPSFSRDVDLFFAGHAPWLLWVFAFCVFYASVASAQPESVARIWFGSLILIALWSAYIDFGFFRNVAGVERPGWSLLAQRAVSWTLFFAVFGGVSFWPGLVEELGLR